MRDSLKHLTILSATGCAVAASSAPRAQQGAPVELAPVTVTGEKITRPDGETTSSVVVVPAERLPPVQNRDVYDALRFAPNVVETSSGGQPIIRGIDASGGPGFGGGAAFSGARPRATVFVDGVPELSSITRGLEPGVFDLEQVEIYRGPQSTIQGRNSLAGAIVVRTRDLTFEPEAVLEGGVRTQGLTYFGGAAVPAPLVKDQIAARLAVDRQEGRSFDEYTFPGLNRARWNQDDAINARAKILVLPEALPAASAKLTLAHQIDQQPSTPGVVTGPDLGDGEDNSDNFGITRARSDTAALELGYELAPGLRLELLPSYVDARLNIDTPNRVLEFEETSRQWSGELPAVYDPAGGRAQGVAGVYGYHRSLEQKNPSDALFLAADDEQNTLAAFGEATAMLWGPFGVLLGGRLERETQDRDFDGGFGLGLDVDETINIFLPKAGLVYRPEGARFSAALTAQRGYNAGGGSVSFLSGTPYVFDEETSWTYELSARSTHLEGRVQLAANLFYSTFEDYQVFAAGPEGPQDTITLNAPEAPTYGAELEVHARPVPALELFGGLGLLETELTDFEDSTQDYDGNSFPGAAPLTLSVGAVADLPLGIRLAADASYVDGYHSAINNEDGDEVGDRLVVNARAEVGWRGATLFAFASNLLDEDYFLSRDTAFQSAVIGAPRTLGVGARLEY